MTEEMHGRSIVVWDVPATVNCGAAFAIRAGIKCAEACPPDGWVIEVRDPAGAVLASAAPEPEPWAGTAGLFPAAIRLQAPAEPGHYAWTAAAPAATAPAATATAAAGEGTDAPGHAAAESRFSVHAVPEGDCRLTVIAVDRAAQAPVAGARVVAHPYRAVTDSEGRAELRLPRGRYRVFVSGRDFFPFRTDGELAGDLTIRAELEIDRGPSDAELWG